MDNEKQIAELPLKSSEIQQSANSNFDANQALMLVMEAAKNPEVDAAKMQTLVDLQMKMLDYSKKEEFNKSKIAAIMEMPSISKGGAIKNGKGQVQSRYSKFEDINRVVKPILASHNLAITFDVDQGQNNMLTVTPILSHTNGHSERGGSMPLAIDQSGSKNATQGAGSSSSYGKRHTMKAMLNIIEDGEDNDGKTKSISNELLEDARNAASCGLPSYERWFKEDISNEQRLELVNKGHHITMKQLAAKSEENVIE